MVNVPISIGELFDKISILYIKIQNIQEPSKLKNINKELALLEKEAKKINSKFLCDFHYKKLQKVNAVLWDIEDGKRAHEKSKKFGSKFIYLARQVYIMNDERANLKRAINKKYKSGIVEEKSHKKYI
jgi:hypothetical protein